MEWALLGLALAALGMAGLALKYLSASRDDRVALVKMDAQFQRSTADFNDAKRKLFAEIADHEETRTRLEAVVALRDTRIHQLEMQLDDVLKDIDPHLLGSSLRDLSLLGREPASGTVAAARPEAAASLPASVTAVLGAAGGGPKR